MARLYTDNAATVLSSAITSTGQTSIDVTDGSHFPTVTSPDYFMLTITQPDTESSWEIVKVTNRVGNTLTVQRAQESTTASTWASGSKVELRLTALAIQSAFNGVQTGETTLDFGAAPGTNIVSTVVSGLTEIKSDSRVFATISLKSSANHNAYEHGIVDMTIRAGNIIPGTSMEIVGVSTQRLSGSWNVQYSWTL